MVSVNAVLTLFKSAATAVGVSVGVPTTKPAAVIVVLAAESATPCSYRRLRSFSNSGLNCLLELS